MTPKQAYLRNLTMQPSDWIAASASNPSPYMTRVHVLLHLIELRRRKHIQSYYDAVASSEGWA